MIPTRAANHVRKAFEEQAAVVVHRVCWYYSVYTAIREVREDLALAGAAVAATNGAGVCQPSREPDGSQPAAVPTLPSGQRLSACQLPTGPGQPFRRQGAVPSFSPTLSSISI